MRRPLTDNADFAALLTRTLVLPLVLLGLLATFFTAEVLYLRSLSQWVDHTDQVIANTTNLQKVFVDAETGLRGRLLMHQDVFLQPYEAAQVEVVGAASRLRGLFADNPEQLARLDAIEAGWRGWNELSVKRLQQDRAGSPLDQDAALDAKGRMDGIRAIIDDVLQQERMLRQRRVDAVEQSSRLALGLGGMLALALGGLIAVAGRNQLVSLSEQYEETVAAQQDQNAILERQEWIARGQMGTAAAARGDDGRELDATATAAAVVRAVGAHLGAAVGALYVVERTRGDLEWRAGFGGSGPATFDVPATVARDEGWMGRAVSEKRPILLADVPEGHVKLVSGTGASAPRHLLLAPLSAEGRTVGVVELGFLTPPDERAAEFLTAVAELAGSMVRSAEYRAFLAALLEQTQRQAEALQVNQEELRVANEELEEHTRALQRSHAQLETQQEELEATNSELEEQTQLLEHERDALEATRSDLLAKAEQLAQSNRFKSEFLANMSHELRTPLNSSLILAKLLADNKQENLTPEQVEFAQTIYASGNDLLSLINDILDLSRIEAGQVEIRPAPVAVGRLLDGLRRTFEPMTAQKGLRLDLRHDVSMPETIETDGQRLQQILTNLLSNAIKFTAEGEVALEASTTGPALVFTVRDSGIGIPADKLEVIFDAFCQADGSMHRKYGGTGLGLTISRDLARRMGGDIVVSSVPGRGSTFRVTLPARPDAIPPAAPPPPAPPPAATTSPPAAPAAVADDRIPSAPEGRAILVIEDDERFARILADMAHEQGFHCLHATTASDGIALAKRHRPKAIVLDMHLPDGSGLTVLERLKRDGDTRHIPVHVMSVEDYGRRALELGAVGYAIKPIDRDGMLVAFERLRRKFEQEVGRVLVVEDVPAQRESLRHLLQSEHVEITAVGDAVSGLEQLRTRTFDCLVLDLGLPDMSGYELLERIAADEAFSFPPVIVYTGRELSPAEELRLRRHSSSVVIKGARSPERLLDEVTLFLHRVESSLPREQQRLLRDARNRETAFEGRRVLLVEDDVRNIFALSSVLEPRGALLEIARNGREALDALDRARRESRHVDIVLMDVMMPEMDGLTAMREIRRRPEWAKLPMIALTAKAMPEDRDQCLAAGANDYIAKPLDVEKLLSLIRVWMRKPTEIA